MKNKTYIAILLAGSIFSLSALAETSPAASSPESFEADVIADEYSWLDTEAKKALLEEKLTIHFNLTDTEIKGELIWNASEK